MLPQANNIIRRLRNAKSRINTAFLSLLETYIDLDEIIPISFRNHFYASTGRSRKYPLKALLWALIIQRIFSIPTDQLLLAFLTYSKPLREFCGFIKVPDASKITRFKQDFLDDLQIVYDKSTRKCHRGCQCANPCTDSSCGRMIHIYPEKNLRAYPGVLRGTEYGISLIQVRLKQDLSAQFTSLPSKKRSKMLLLRLHLNF